MRALGYFGKLPAHADFVRFGARGGPLLRIFERWLSQFLSLAPGLRAASSPRATEQFLFSAPGVAEVMIGAWRMSEDRVGRQFPLVVYELLPDAALRGRLRATPIAYEEFFAQTATLLEARARLDRRVFASELAASAIVEETAWRSARSRCAELFAETKLRSVRDRLFEGSDGRLAFAVSCIPRAIAAWRRCGRGSEAVTLLCPAERDEDRALWLALLERELASVRALPSISWHRDGSTAAISLGAPPPEHSPWLASTRAAQRRSRVWSLRTESRALHERALAELPPEVRDSLACEDATLESLVRRAPR